MGCLLRLCLVIFFCFFLVMPVWGDEQSNVIIITSEEIRAMNVHSITDVLNQIPNPDLEPETADNYTLSFFIKPTSWISGGIFFYYNKIKDRITYVWRDNGKGSYENFGEVTYQGADFVLNLKIFENLSLKTTYAYLRAIDKKNGHWMAAKPRHRIYADLSYRPFSGFSAILNIKYESMQYTRSDNKALISGYIIANLRMEYGPCWAKTGFGDFELFAEIKNLGDVHYEYGDGGLAPPLTWMAGGNFRF